MAYLTRAVRKIFAGLALMASFALAHAASPDPQKTQQLLSLVQSKAELGERALALQQLALVATPEAVPAMVPLLGDEKLGQYARDVLENMPDAAAGAALREALTRLQGNALAGAVNSLGLRRDTAAVEPLTRIATAPSSAATIPAVLALGRIRTSDALRFIESALARPSAEIRSAAGEACLVAADELSRDGKSAEAVALYERVRTADVPLPLRVSATRGAILAGGAAGLALAIQQLHARELELRDMALRTLRELTDARVTTALVPELDRLNSELQALVIEVMVDHGDRAALPAIERRAKSGPNEVRIAALQALGRIGEASSLPILFEALADPTGAIADAALASLARIPASETNRLVQERVASADLAQRIKLIGVLGERNAADATPELLRLAAENQVEVSKAALRALGLVARPSDLPQLIRLSVTARDDAAKTLADRAIVTTSMKVLEPGRRADAVLAAFRDERDPAIRSALVRPLSAIVRSMESTHEVFFTLRAALKDESALVREAALKALAEWPNAAPTTTLLELAKASTTSPAQRETALSGAIRMTANVASGRERSSLEPVAAFTAASRLVASRSEKLALVSGLGELRRPEAVSMLRPYLDDPAVRTEAALALVQIAPALLASKNGSELRSMLEKIAANEKDETVRQKAVRLARGGEQAKEKGKAKGKANAVAPAAAKAVLFNGNDLAGWDGDPGVWRVRDGTIVGGSLGGNPRNEFLATTRRYKNFVLRLEYKLVGTEGFVNGGVQFRSVRVPQPPNEMSGYQADIGAGHSGCLYDESRRKKFLARGDEDLIKRLEKVGDWNVYEIRCEGPKIELSLNGQKTLTYTEEDATVELEGLVALQIHGNCKAEIAFRNLHLTELP